MIELFHFLRPAWLLALLPLVLMFWLLQRTRQDSASWRAVIDARLLPHVLSGADAGRAGTMRWIYFAVAACLVIALAGPTWEQLPQQVYQKQGAIVIALDLSRSMNATDIKPSRLARARHKIADILNLQTEGQSALVVYAADAFAVTPLTSDIDTILALLPGLESELMPAQGTRADRALRLGIELFTNAGVSRGDLLLVSDGVGGRELELAQDLLGQHPGYRLSVLAIGTSEGGPIPLESGGFLKERSGAIVISRLRQDNLRALAKSGGGVYATISTDDIDVNTLAYLFESGIDERAAELVDQAADLWRELGPWLILLCLPLAALAFRRGAIWMLAAVTLLAPPAADAFDWQALWQNRDQRASRLFEQGEHAAAARLFDDPAWRAASNYREGDYAAALERWQQRDDDTALYNRGNALARLGRYQDALESYDELLGRNPQHQDALFNKKAIEDWLRQQQQQQGQQQQQPGERSGQQQNDAAQQSGQQQADAEQRQDGGQQAQGQQPGQQQAQPQPAEQQQAQDQGGHEDSQSSAPSQSAQNQAGAADQPKAAEAERDNAARGDDMAQLDEQMTQQAAEQWLRKIPDDPGGLLRRKFLYQYRKRGGVDAEGQSW